MEGAFPCGGRTRKSPLRDCGGTDTRLGRGMSRTGGDQPTQRPLRGEAPIGSPPSRSDRRSNLSVSPIPQSTGKRFAAICRIKENFRIRGIHASRLNGRMVGNSRKHRDSARETRTGRFQSTNVRRVSIGTGRASADCADGRRCRRRCGCGLWTSAPGALHSSRVRSPDRACWAESRAGEGTCDSSADCKAIAR